MANAQSSPEEIQRQIESNLEKQRQMERERRQMEEDTKSLMEKLNEVRKNASQPPERKRLRDADAGRRATVTLPRSQSNMGYAMNRGDDQMQRSISLHSGPALAMCRSVSSAALESQMPFAQTGRAAPFPNVNTPMMLNYIRSDDGTVSARMAAMANRLSPVDENPLADVGQDPADYLARMGEDYPSFSNQPQGQFLSAGNDYYHHVPSATPSLVSGTTAAEALPLSRQSSTYEAGSVGALEMNRIGSGHSQRADTMFAQDSFHASDFNSEYSLQGKGLAGLLLGVGTGASREIESADMARSISNSSSSSYLSKCSTASNQEKRAKEARERQIENGKRTQIAPKPEDINKANSRSQSEAEQDGKLALAKNTYQRPMHPRVQCNQCTEYPDGFRGEHELRRHTNAKHEKKVRKFICRDPATAGISSGVRVVNPLNRCKQCVQKKKYGAYYNAAAHLRRTHFKPKLGRNKNKPTEAERRAGKAGGDWPPMSELKNWMEEIEVLASDDRPVEANTEVDDDGRTSFIDTFDPDSFSSLDTASSPASMLSGAAFEYGASLTPTSPVMSQIPSELSFPEYTFTSAMSSHLEPSPYPELFFNA